MVPSPSTPIHQALRLEYAETITRHDKTINAALIARNKFLTADRNVLRGLKRTLNANTKLIERSNVYRRHQKHVKFLAKRLSSWGSDLRARSASNELDHSDLLHYGSYFYRMIKLTSDLAIMNLRGMQAKDKCECRIDHVELMRKRKESAIRDGQKAYEKQRKDNSEMISFVKKLYARMRELEVEGHTLTDSYRLLGSILEAANARMTRLSKRPSVDTDWNLVCQQDRAIRASDYSVAEKEAELYREFEEMMKCHSWCPCCGVGSPKKNTHRQNKGS